VVVREKLRLPTSSMINWTMRLSGRNRSNLLVQAALTAMTDFIKESIWFIFVYCFCRVDSVKFLQLSFVIFVGEELTVLGFVREECEKNFENHWFSLCHFWIRTRNECSVIYDLAIHKLLEFCTRYLCEAVSSKLIIIKSKNRSFLKNVKNVLCPALSCINLRMIDLCKNYQLHPSH